MANRRMRARRAVLVLVALASIVALALPTSPVAADDSAAPHASGFLSYSSTRVTFRPQTIGTFSIKFVLLRNNGGVPLTIDSISFTRRSGPDYSAGTDCLTHGHPRTLAPGATCGIAVVFLPAHFGERHSKLYIVHSGAGRHTIVLSGFGTEGYYLPGGRGGVASFGVARFHGSVSLTPLSAPIIGMTTTPSDDGYWLLGRDGGVFSFGRSRFHGSPTSLNLHVHAVGIARTRSGNGYWVASADGGVFSFGDAKFYGSAGGLHLAAPIVGIAPTPSGKGYWLVAADGGIFAFGDAQYFGSTGGLSLAAPIVGMTPAPSGQGYWLVAADGGVFSFGKVKYYGAALGFSHGAVVGMAVAPDGLGYWLSTNRGAVYTFGQVPYYGDILHKGRTGVAPVTSLTPLPRHRPGKVVFDTSGLASALSGLVPFDPGS